MQNSRKSKQPLKILKLIDINKDRRYKLTTKEVAKIKSLRWKNNSKIEIAKKFNISRQRVAQIWSDPELLKAKNILDSKRVMDRYRIDDDYRLKILEKKRDAYKYKVEMLKKHANHTK